VKVGRFKEEKMRRKREELEGEKSDAKKDWRINIFRTTGKRKKQEKR
jgi:hypothetical protein